MSKPKRKKGAFREMGIVIALAVMFTIFTLIDTSFISIYNILDIINQSTINGLLAIGITLPFSQEALTFLLVLSLPLSLLLPVDPGGWGKSHCGQPDWYCHRLCPGACERQLGG